MLKMSIYMYGPACHKAPRIVVYTSIWVLQPLLSFILPLQPSAPLIVLTSSHYVSDLTSPPLGGHRAGHRTCPRRPWPPTQLFPHLQTAPPSQLCPHHSPPCPPRQQRSRICFLWLYWRGEKATTVCMVDHHLSCRLPAFPSHQHAPSSFHAPFRLSRIPPIQ